MAKGTEKPIDYLPANTPVPAASQKTVSPVDAGKDFVKTGERTN